MMRTGIMHPDLLAGLARLGHGSQVLVADALFPHATGANPDAPRVHLNLAPGLVGADDIIRLIAETVHVEAAAYMDSPDGASEPVKGYQALLADHRHSGGQPISWQAIERFAFYDTCQAANVGLVIASGDVRPYANLLLTIGVP